MHVDFPQIRVASSDEALIVHSDTPLQSLSSAVVGGGFATTKAIINRHVDKNYDCANPIDDLHSFAAARGITNFIGLLTAVWMHKARAVTCQKDGLTVCAVITAGVGNAIAAGVSPPQVFASSTINMIVLVDGRLSPAAMVNAIITMTEAKTAVLTEREIHTPDGLSATGTSTDAVVLACTGRGAELSYGGPVTSVGYLIAKCIRECLGQALDAE